MAVAASGCAAACGPGGGSSPQSFGDIAAGNVSALAMGSLVAIAGAAACLGLDSGGVYAMTLTCTHQGCEASVSGDEVACPCHGSVFDSDGNVVNGPAAKPLQHFAVSVDATGNITVHGGTEVAESVRAKP
jgi:cytochrome b6-f complex iron-sulfur subunit